MEAVSPWSNIERGFTIPGDSEDNIMLRTGSCVGMSPTLAVWRFGFAPGSDFARALGVEVTDYHSKTEHTGGFVWVLCTRKTAKIKEVFRGFAVELPSNFRNVIDWEPS